MDNLIDMDLYKIIGVEPTATEKEVICFQLLLLFSDLHNDGFRKILYFLYFISSLAFLLL